MEIKIEATKQEPEPQYTWGVNLSGNLFLLKDGKGLFIGPTYAWDSWDKVSSKIVQPLPKGTKITITV
jgi:hypothetical protein